MNLACFSDLLGMPPFPQREAHRLCRARSARRPQAGLLGALDIRGLQFRAPGEQLAIALERHGESLCALWPTPATASITDCAASICSCSGAAHTERGSVISNTPAYGGFAQQNFTASD